MSAVLKLREWTPAQRAEQSRKFRDRQIWLNSTGPKTVEGKAASSRNARGEDYHLNVISRKTRHYVRVSKYFGQLMMSFYKTWKHMTPEQRKARFQNIRILENELIARHKEILVLMEAPTENSAKIIPFPGRPHKNGT